MKWLVGLGFLMFIGVNRVDATTLSLHDAPNVIEADSTFEVLVNFVTTAKKTTYFLAGSFYKQKGGKLFGYTQVGDGFVSRVASPSSYFPITTSDEGSWSGKIKLKAGIDGEGFEGEGDYYFRIDRFTGKTESPAESSNTVEIKLKYLPPVTPSPTPTATPTAKPTTTPEATNSPTPSATVAPTSKPKVTKNLTLPTPILEINLASTSGEELAATQASSPAAVLGTTDETSHRTGATVILIGSLILASGAIPLSIKLVPQVK